MLGARDSIEKIQSQKYARIYIFQSFKILLARDFYKKTVMIIQIERLRATLLKKFNLHPNKLLSSHTHRQNLNNWRKYTFKNSSNYL